MRLLQAAVPEEEMKKETKPVQKNTNRHEVSAAAVAASSSSFQVGSESKRQGLNPSSNGTPPNFVCQMITTSMPLQAEEKEEIDTNDDDALLPAIAQVRHNTR
jgi:Na+-transporting methylmalonyl-CoA/oxaloacetate decarboxylase gamma subunit